jgi:surfactin synthase thioesterase subunit
VGVDPGNKQTARIATDVSIADEVAQLTVIKEVAGEDRQAIAAMIPTLRRRSCASYHFRPSTKSRPCPFVAAKATAVHSFTRIAPAAGGTGCAGVDTRNSQATGTAAATIR